MKHRNILLATLAATTSMLAGCADSSVILTGQPHAATTPDKVQVYFQQPARKYEVIGIVTGSSKNKFGVTRQGKTDAALRSVKEKAAEIGANGVIMQTQGTTTGGAVGTVSGGLVIASSINNVEVSGTAIFIP